MSGNACFEWITNCDRKCDPCRSAGGVLKRGLKGSNGVLGVPGVSGGVSEIGVTHKNPCLFRSILFPFFAYFQLNISNIPWGPSGAWYLGDLLELIDKVSTRAAIRTANSLGSFWKVREK